MIEINNLTTRQDISQDFLKKIAKIVLVGEDRKEAALSIVLVGEGRMKKLNSQYRNKNKSTDVLAFPEPKNFKKFGANSVELGEVVISPREAGKNAKKLKLSFDKELARILIHGILHLFGYDHEKTAPEAEKMKKKEEYYLSQISF